MRNRTKIIIGCLTVALALLAIVGSATARRIEVDEQAFLVLFRELTFEGGTGSPTICEVNIEGSFHSRTISKVSGQLIGYISQAIIHHPCARGEAWTLNGSERATNTLPWHILYLRFTGTLPTITGVEVQLNNGGFIVEPGCLYEATRANGMRATINIAAEAGSFRKAESMTVVETARIPSRTFLCPEGILAGRGTVGKQTTWTPPLVRLVQ
jgi:hypothetical protein